VVSDYALSLQVTSFPYNAYDVISRDLYEAIARDASARAWVYGRRRKGALGHLPGYRLGKYWRFSEDEARFIALVTGEVFPLESGRL
jgi:hypothetical protein